MANPASQDTPLWKRAVLGLSIYFLFIYCFGGGGGTQNSTKQPLSSDAVTWILNDNTVVHIGGPHRGGTTLLADLVSAHPGVHGLGASSSFVGSRSMGKGGTKGPGNEGIFLQTVFPSYRLAMSPWEITFHFLQGTLRENGTGWGSYAFAENAHLTEANESGLLTENSRRKLMSQWASYWNFNLTRVEIELEASASNPQDSQLTTGMTGESRRVLLEKSPSNIMMWRYLNALWHLKGTTPSDILPKPDLRFIFITRHPLAVAVAQNSWYDASHLSWYELVKHWLHQQLTLANDLHEMSSARVLRLKYEDLVADPANTLTKVYRFLDVGEPAYSAEVVLRRIPVRPGKNRKYIDQFCKWLLEDGCVGYSRMMKEQEAAVVSTGYGYSLVEWGLQCQHVSCAQQWTSTGHEDEDEDFK